LKPSDRSYIAVGKVFRENLVQELIGDVTIFIDPQPPCVPPKTLVEQIGRINLCSNNRDGSSKISSICHFPTMKGIHFIDNAKETF
jgi:hypothetical protein